MDDRVIVVVALSLAIWLAVRASTVSHLPGSTAVAFVFVAFAAVILWFCLVSLVFIARGLRKLFGSRTRVR